MHLLGKVLIDHDSNQNTFTWYRGVAVSLGLYFDPIIGEELTVRCNQQAAQCPGTDLGPNPWGGHLLECFSLDFAKDGQRNSGEVRWFSRKFKRCMASCELNDDVPHAVFL